MRTLILSAALLLSGATMTWAQQNNQPRQRMTTLAGGLEISVPIGEFDDTWGRQLVGLSGNITLPMRRLPLSYGFDFSWASMGGSSREVPVNEPNLAVTTGDLSVRSNVYGYHGLLRLQPFQGKVSPYVDGMFGLRHFVTRTKIEVDGMDQPYLEQRNESSMVGSTGLAAGIYYAPARNIVLEGRVERLTGGLVNYVDPRSIEISPGGDVQYSTLSSGTRIVNITFGIGLRF